MDGAVTGDLIPGAPGAPAPSTVDADLVVSLDGVGVKRSGTALVHDVDWRVELDERWVVLGPNGAGKTTLLNLASGRLYPTNGVAHVLGERIGRTDVNELRTRIGLSTATLAERIPTRLSLNIELPRVEYLVSSFVRVVTSRHVD
ncbi:ABC transporter ATP-binding protein [Micromonospora sp. M42]|nr:ABC transporter ATP-binding protein [Micromonospora sp. M42]